jgi:hypothetical protein
MFALSKAVDKAMLLANTVAADAFIQKRCSQRNSGQWILWFGQPQSSVTESGKDNSSGTNGV